jgi:hypothetical protein
MGLGSATEATLNQALALIIHRGSWLPLTVPLTA